MKTIIRTLTVALLAMVSVLGLGTSGASALAGSVAVPLYPGAPRCSVYYDIWGTPTVNLTPTGASPYAVNKYDYFMTTNGISQPITTVNVGIWTTTLYVGSDNLGILLSQYSNLSQGTSLVPVSVTARAWNQAGSSAWTTCSMRLYPKAVH